MLLLYYLPSLLYLIPFFFLLLSGTYLCLYSTVHLYVDQSEMTDGRSTHCSPLIGAPAHSYAHSLKATYYRGAFYGLTFTVCCPSVLVQLFILLLLQS